MEIKFNELSTSDLHVDAIYKGGTQFKNINDEPFHYLIPNCENIGGFRKTLRKDGTRKFGYIVLYTTMAELLQTLKKVEINYWKMFFLLCTKVRI